ncbi:HAD hydrolase family protein [Candidatus Bathyarchaeota archaeon A05DMB-2]|nr:HAD hydrolase family protein [Candidatus Bathyarchaeota archaeon A05DMB-2]
MKRIFISDCEGPISRNDNAFEITARFVPDGDKLFTLISKYDDVLADVLKKPGYSAGSTLKLILPFLKAYNITDKLMEEFSAKNLILIASSKETLRHVRTIASSFIVSTSYEHYIKALCKALDFPFENTYCTKLSIDKYTITSQEKAQLRELAREIAQMKLINIPPSATSIQDFSGKDQETIKRLDEIFWTEMPKMGIGNIFSEVITVGGEQKAEAIADALSRLQARLSDVMYVGDSITDVEAFKLVKENDGLTVSFNGNSYAVKNAEVAVQSENSTVTALIADLFCTHGRERTLHVLENWNREALRKSQVSQPLLDKFLALYPETLPKVQIVTHRNMELIAKESSEFRKKVRGESIGRLG